MRIRYSQRARDESYEAARAYRDRDPSTEPRFKERLRELTRTIRRHPEIGQQFGDFRRLPLLPFPYVIFYEVTEDAVVVLAIAHTSREPGYWRS